MKVMELLDEIDEIIETASTFPLTGKLIIDGEEITQIVKEIREELPSEIKVVLRDAQKQAEALIDSDDITLKARIKANQIEKANDAYVRQIKMGCYEHIDSMFYNFQDKMDELNAIYFGKMFENLEETFNSINTQIAQNREEIRDLAYRTQAGE